MDGPIRQGAPLIVSRHLSEPDSALAQGHSLIPPTGFGSESSLSKVWRAVRRAVLLRLPSLGAARLPFDRLEFWTASHPLSFKLRLYSVSEPKVDMWRGFTWETLRYWQDLMSGEDVPGWTNPAFPIWIGWSTPNRFLIDRWVKEGTMPRERIRLKVYITDRDDNGRLLGYLAAYDDERSYDVELAPHLTVLSNDGFTRNGTIAVGVPDARRP